jgi:hypothetical protein
MEKRLDQISYYILSYTPLMRVPRHFLKLVPCPEPELHVELNEER